MNQLGITESGTLIWPTSRDDGPEYISTSGTEMFLKNYSDCYSGFRFAIHGNGRIIAQLSSGMVREL